MILAIFALTFFLFYIITNEEFYYVERIFANSNFIFVEVVWICVTLIMAIFLSYFFGWQHIFEITILFLSFYIIGYLLARFVWKSWKSLKKDWKVLIILIIICSVLIPSILLGIMFIRAEIIRIGVISFIFGFGILGSTGLNALMLQLFLDESGNDVLEDPPSKLVIIGLINTLIVSYIVLFLMILFIPVPPVSKKGSRSVKGSYHKSSSTSRFRSNYWGYRRRQYIFFGPEVTEHQKLSPSHYWEIAMNKKELRDPVIRSQVDEAKPKIINILLEEEVVPTSRDLQRVVGIPHNIFDLALDELQDENKIIYHLRAKSNWWSKGYSITGHYYSKLERKEDIDKVEISIPLIEKFIDIIKNESPVNSKYKLWELGNEVGIRPRWKITPTINKLRKEGILKYSRKKPKGWIIT